MNSRERVLGLMSGGLPDRLPFMPITMMFAADRAGVSYRSYASDARVLADAQIRVAAEFGFDFVSAISDPAREAADLGAAVRWFDNQPPALDENNSLLADKAVLAKLKQPDPLGGGRMHDRVNAIALLKERAGGDLPVEGWIEGPCAEAADLRGINALMLDFYDDPAFITDLFEFLLANALRFARAQVEAGADWIGVGDAAASLIGPRFYHGFVWPYQKKLVDGLHEMGTKVRLHICGNTRKMLGFMGRLGCEIVDLDYFVPISEAREQMPPTQVLLGNIEPVRALRDGTPASITAAVAECHRQAGPRYVVSAGCEVVRDTAEENLRALQQYAETHAPEQIPELKP